jgi:hypothetical protein
MKKKQTVRDVVADYPCDVLTIKSNGQVLDSRTMDYEAQIFDELLDLRVRCYNVETYREYCSWDDSTGWHNKTVLTIEVEYNN